MKISQAVDFHLSYHPRIESFFVEKKGIAKYEKMIKRLKYGPIIMHSHVHGIVCAVGTDSISVPQSRKLYGN